MKGGWYQSEPGTFQQKDLYFWYQQNDCTLLGKQRLSSCQRREKEMGLACKPESARGWEGFDQKCKVLSSHWSCLCCTLYLPWLTATCVREWEATVEKAGLLRDGKEMLKQMWVRKPGVQDSVIGREEEIVKLSVLTNTSSIPGVWSEQEPISQLMGHVES